MKFTILAFLFTFVTGIKENERYLEAPDVTGVSLEDPEGLYIQWWPVRQNLQDPLVGYKIRLWEISETSETQTELVNGDKFPAEVTNDVSTQQFTVNNTNPMSREEVVGPTNNGMMKASVKIKYNTIYEIRVLGFKKDVDGPMSSPVRIKVVKGEGYQVVLHRTVTGCQVTVPSEVEYASNPYPYEFNSVF